VSIEVRSLRIGYPGGFRLSVDGFRIESRKVTAIVGRNGAGKSTFLRCLGGIIAPPKRSILIGGQDLVSLKGSERARRISYVPQEQTLALNYSVLDLVLMGRAAFVPTFSAPSRADQEMAREAIRFVGLSGFENREISRLSSGERRLALIARTLAQSSDILLLDEPTTFLDPKHAVEVMDLCRKLAAEKGKTVVITLHDLELAMKSSDIMVFMKAGKILASGRPEDVVAEELLERVYDLPMSIVPFDGKKIIVR
jgi:iron complex transport system ATP-binding protein